MTPALVLLAAISLGLTLWRWLAAAQFPLHRRQPVAGPLPSLTVLKPLKGCDAETRGCLRSWLAQQYPGPMQILFGVASADDPVCVVVKELLSECAADARLVICGQSLGANAKVSTLQQLEPHVRHDMVMISDADVHVPADFCAQMAECLRQAGASLVNCFYRLGNPATLAMQWEATAINADFWTTVLQARMLEPVDFALGAAMALPASELKAIGGFAALADYLADDNQLGRRIAARGGKIEFARIVAECRDAPMNWRQAWAHQSRWARTIRVCQPTPYFLSVLNNSTVWPLLLWLWGGRWTLPIFFGCLLVRTATALHQESKMNQRAPQWGFFWMPVVKDLLDLVVWAGAFLSNRIRWRGQEYEILPEGRLRLYS